MSSEGEEPLLRYLREEPDAQRLDRNYAELLQELRLVFTGVQILFAFLLSIAFQQRFAGLGTPERAIYVLALVFTACASILLIAPAAVHRILFRHNVKDEIVDVTAGLVKAGLVFLALGMVTGFGFVVAFVGGVSAALALTGALTALVVVTWLVAPRRRRLRAPEPAVVADGEALKQLLKDDYPVDGARRADGRSADPR